MLVLKELVKTQFPVSSCPVPITDLMIGGEEANVISCAAGYSLHELQRKIENNSHRPKEKLVLAIMELVVDSEEDSDNKYPSSLTVEYCGMSKRKHYVVLFYGRGTLIIPITFRC